MSDYVKIRVTYPNQRTEPAPGGGPAAPAPEPPIRPVDGGAASPRGVSPILFAVIGALVVVGGVAAGWMYSGSSGPFSTSPPEQQATKAAGADPRANEIRSAAAPVALPAAATAETGAPATAPSGVADAGADDVSRFETGGSAPASDAQTASPRPAPTATPTPTPTLEVAALPPPVKRPAVPGRASVSAASAAVSGAAAGGSVARSQLTSGVRAREPVDRLSSRIEIGERGRRTLFYFTELRGLSGETVFHRWEHDGRTMVTLRFDVGSDRWRAYSSKTIPANQSGDWRVVVANAEGDVLASSDFVAE